MPNSNILPLHSTWAQHGDAAHCNNEAEYSNDEGYGIAMAAVVESKVSGSALRFLYICMWYMWVCVPRQTSDYSILDRQTTEPTSFQVRFAGCHLWLWWRIQNAAGFHEGSRSERGIADAMRPCTKIHLLYNEHPSRALFQVPSHKPRSQLFHRITLWSRWVELISHVRSTT